MIDLQSHPLLPHRYISEADAMLVAYLADGGEARCTDEAQYIRLWRQGLINRIDRDGFPLSARMYFEPSAKRELAIILGRLTTSAT